MLLNMDRSVLFLSRILFRLFFIVLTIPRLGFAEFLKCEDSKTSHYNCNWKCGDIDIDLNKLLQNFPNQPVFDFQQAPSSKYSYSYEPCVPYTTQGSCKNVAICQKTNPNTFYDVGAWDKVVANWNTTSKELQINYNSSDGNRKSVVNVKCVSGQAGKLTVLGERKPPGKIYDFTLETELVCQGDSGGGGGLSPGSIMLIVFFVLVIVYFVVGFLILWFARGARGTEAIPNYDFWSDLPSLVKDGVVFTTNCCKTEPAYAQI